MIIFFCCIKANSSDATHNGSQESNGSNENIAPDELKCSICNITSTTKEQLQIHLDGKKHSKKLSALLCGKPAMTKKSDKSKGKLI